MDLKNKFILKFSIGFSLGIIVCTIITSIMTTNTINDGNTYICDPGFIKMIGNELAAFIIQCIVSGIFGALCLSSNIVYELEDWSILKATVTHFLIVMTLFFITGFYLRWLYPKDYIMNGIIILVMIIIYIFIWLTQYISYKKEVKRINKKIKKKNKKK